MPTNREELLRATQLVRPALAAQGYIQALTHVCLNENGVTAYNDIAAINVALEHDLDCCVPGDLFIKALTGFSAKDVKVTPADTGSSVVLSSGRSKMKLATLSTRDFPFKHPQVKPKATDQIDLGDDMLRGVQRCLISVNTNASHPAQQGVTLDQVDGRAVFFSTDNLFITRYETDSKISLPADEPVILPTFFCEQALALAKAFPEDELVLHLLDGGLLLVVGEQKAFLFQRQMAVEMTPLDFPSIIQKNIGDIDTVAKKLTAIPDGWDVALSRAVLVQSSALEPRLDINSDGDVLTLQSKSDCGETDEELKWGGPGMKKGVSVNPSFLVRAAANSTHVFFTDRVVVLGTKDATLLHLIATYGKK